MCSALSDQTAKVIIALLRLFPLVTFLHSAVSRGPDDCRQVALLWSVSGVCVNAGQKPAPAMPFHSSHAPSKQAEKLQGQTHRLWKKVPLELGNQSAVEPAEAPVFRYTCMLVSVLLLEAF